MERIIEKVKRLREELSNGNGFGERVFLVAATKMQTAEAINAAIAAGVDAVAENRVQEFRDKTERLLACPQHFIGHLQTNKVKYLVGKIDLFHSCDRYELAFEISRVSVLRGVVSDVLVQVNAGNEDAKGGFSLAEAYEAYAKIKQMPGMRVKGFMAMLPHSEDEELLASLADEMRKIYEKARFEDDQIEYLSMGMSGDYRLCVKHGSNMIRVGSTIFGERDYAKA
ncbi:MAG: YggS family pyridoxal phosphate-dependent enzyme [Clostridia bacterium]|nr:YggS family pyridoxal phosphate-dependent enzyme [Clostridia bacterium]